MSPVSQDLSGPTASVSRTPSTRFSSTDSSPSRSSEASTGKSSALFSPVSNAFASTQNSFKDHASVEKGIPESPTSRWSKRGLVCSAHKQVSTTATSCLSGPSDTGLSSRSVHATDGAPASFKGRLPAQSRGSNDNHSQSSSPNDQRSETTWGSGMKNRWRAVLGAGQSGIERRGLLKTASKAIKGCCKGSESPKTPAAPARTPSLGRPASPPMGLSHSSSSSGNVEWANASHAGRGSHGVSQSPSPSPSDLRTSYSEAKTPSSFHYKYFDHSPSLKTSPSHSRQSLSSTGGQDRPSFSSSRPSLSSSRPSTSTKPAGSIWDKDDFHFK
ncbi:unnamed protein product [Sympodiomycopsis kandeliae]